MFGSGQVYAYRGGPAGTMSSAPTLVAAPAGGGGQFGSALAGGGDMDGDGLADVVIGASAAHSGAGGAYVYLGRGAGIGVEAPIVLGASGVAGGAQFGSAVSFAGDVNADGFGDLVIGASGAMNGNAFVYLGGAGGPRSLPDVTLAGEHPNAGFGFAVAGAADVNSDGYDDVVVGAICEPFAPNPDGGAYKNCGAGKVYAYMGAAGTLSPNAAAALVGPGGPDGSFGWAVALADVDGDGCGDLIASAYAVNAYDGAVYLYHGATAGIGATPWATLPGQPSSSENYGWALALQPAPALSARLGERADLVKARVVDHAGAIAVDAQHVLEHRVRHDVVERVTVLGVDGLTDG